MEILAPVGNGDNLIAAVQAGAQAVYLGGDLFSARAYAGNFTDRELEEALSYVHGYGRKLYLTVNTLLKDSEIAGAVDFVRRAWNMGVDAVIFQDPGLFYLVRELYPEVELHASTQLSIHNRPMAQYFTDKGAKRLILARELSLEEIEGLKGINDLEVFVQGALCISYSGNCLMSSLIGGRSGNRGRCAQPCRLDYSLYREDEFLKKGSLISPRELSLASEVDRLREAGVMSLKIEGRMRSPDYTYEAVSTYKRALEGKNFSTKALELSFSRQGFTQAYLYKKGGDHLISDFSGKSGIDLGRVNKGKILLETELRRLDGLASNRGGFRVEKILLEGREVERASAGMEVLVLPKKYREGDQLRKTLDFSAKERIGKILKEPFGVKEGVPVDFSFKVGEAMELGGLRGAIVEEARTAPLSKERVQESLIKSDGPLVLEPSFIDFEEGFVPIREINALRRAYLDRLLEKRRVSRNLEKLELPPVYDRKLEAKKYVIVRKKEHLKLDFRGMELVVDPFFKDPGSLNFGDLEELDSYYLRVPGIVKENIQELAKKILSLRGLRGVLTSNQGMIELLKEKTTLLGDYKLNIMNSYGPSLYKELQGFMVSEELNKKELSQLKVKDQALVYVYGPQEMMVLEYCPLRDGDPCSEPCRRDNFSLRDRKDYKLALGHDIYCRTRIYNGPVKNLLEDIKEIRELGFSSFVMELLEEEFPQELVDSFLEEVGFEVELATRGHYNRGVE